jgi:hypothetical protein
MKKISVAVTFKMIFALMVFHLVQITSFGQDQSDNSSSSHTTTTTTTEHTEWYTAPWVWVVGGAVLILLLVALLSGGRSSSRSTVSKTVDTGRGSVTTVRDTDIDD